MLRAQAGELVLQNPFGSALLAQQGHAVGLLMLQACHLALQDLARSCGSPETSLQLPYALPCCQQCIACAVKFSCRARAGGAALRWSAAVHPRKLRRLLLL